MKYIAIVDDEFLSNFRVDVKLNSDFGADMVLVVEDKTRCTRGIQLKPITKEMFDKMVQDTMKSFGLTEEDIDDRTKQLIKIGDEIYSSMTETKAVVYHIDAWHRYDCFTKDGSSMKLDEHTFNKYWTRTGRNFPQIEAVLYLMKESNNDRAETTDKTDR